VLVQLGLHILNIAIISLKICNDHDHISLEENNNLIILDITHMVINKWPTTMEDQQDKNQMKSSTKPNLVSRRKVKLKVDITPQMIEDLLQSEPESEEYTEQPYDPDNKMGISYQLSAGQTVSEQLDNDQKTTAVQSQPINLSASDHRNDHIARQPKRKVHVNEEQVNNKISIWLNRVPTPPVNVFMGPNITLRLMSIMT
jgi:hypothetical protein